MTNRPEDRKQRPGPPRLWVYTLPGGHRVMAGRTDVDNDRLSLKVAGPNDWWFHVRGTPARHVTKPRGAKPGTVQIRKERIFKVRPALP